MTLYPRTEPVLSAFLHTRGAAMGLPIGGNFELTARCNFHCPMCYVHLSQEDVQARGRELTAQQWIDIARQARDEGLMFALLTGGEPFVRKDFFEIYDAMKNMGLLVSINSNGSLIKGEILQHLIDNPPYRVNISLYGGSAETYEKMCGPSAFETVIENIRAIKAAGIDVRLNVSITPYNRHDLKAIYELAQELQVHTKASSYMYPPIRVHGDCGHRLSPEEAARCSVEWDLLRFSPEQFEQRAQTMQSLAAVEEKECSVDMDTGVSCRAGSSSFWMTWDGKMLPCGMMTAPVQEPLKVGFRQAWDALREETRAIRMPAKCVTCKNREVCSVCAAVCFTETGDYEGVPQYVCDMTEQTLAITKQAYEERKK